MRSRRKLRTLLLSVGLFALALGLGLCALSLLRGNRKIGLIGVSYVAGASLALLVRVALSGHPRDATGRRADP